ncbi:MAG: NAD(P)-dependent oxidoreductase [Flavobacteriales bacterium]
MKIAIYSTHGFDKSQLTEALSEHETIFLEQELNENTAHLAASCEAVVLFTSDQASAPVLEQLAMLGVKYIALRSVGYDHVDIPAAKRLNLKVANVPAYSPYAVAEQAVTLLLALNRKIKQAQAKIDNQDFRLDGLTGMDIHGKTVGIIGLGKIGESFARIMKGFGCKLLGHDPQPRPELEKELNITPVSLEQLYRNADIISIHCPIAVNLSH